MILLFYVFSEPLFLNPQKKIPSTLEDSKDIFSILNRVSISIKAITCDYTAIDKVHINKLRLS
jgi:hypothetical protein